MRLPAALLRPLTLLLRGLAPLLLAALTAGAFAQENGPVPPGRVGQVSLLSGPVTLTDIQTREQQPAALNWPLTSGMRLTTGGWGRAEVRIGSLTLRLDGDSEIDFSRIDDELIQLVIRRGSVALRARARDLLPEIDLTTLRERITLDDTGRYRIDVDRAAGITALTVFAGSARIAADRLAFDVRTGQRGEFSTLPNTGFVLLPITRDAFDDWVASRDRRDDLLASSRYVSPEMTGVESLDEHGTWRTVPEYGTVWFPRVVVAGWVPYRHGRWTWVSPWGWTWIDDAPWGFAPFHYGRWVVVSGAWCWVPGAWVARPVYAPALVAWVGVPGVSIGVGRGPVGWFPLGPREIYIPPYRHPRHYVDRINHPHVPNVRNLPVVQPPPVYVNQSARGSTWVPAEAIGRHEPIRHQLVPGPGEPARWVARPVPPPAILSPNRPAPVPNGLSPSTAPGTRAGPPSAPPPPLATPAMPATPPPAPRAPDRPAETGPRPLPPAVTRPGDERAPPPRMEPPRVEPPRMEPPRIDQPRIDQPRIDQPRIGQPRVDQPRFDQPRVDQPRIEPPRPAIVPPPVAPLTPPAPGAGSTAAPAVHAPVMPRHDHFAPPARAIPPLPLPAAPATAPQGARPGGAPTAEMPGELRQPPRRDPRPDGRPESRADIRGDTRSDGNRAMRP